jgi:hypothetical protein
MPSRGTSTSTPEGRAQRHAADLVRAARDEITDDAEHPDAGNEEASIAKPRAVSAPDT